MIQRDYLVIGAGIGGAALCGALREYDSKGSVTLVGNESTPPYHRPRLFESILLPKTPDPAALLLHPPRWYEEKKIELRLETLVTQVNLDRRLAVLNTGQVIEFRKACFATGSRPRRPQLAGANLGGIHYLRNVRDLFALREVLPGQKNIVIIGGGLLAAECASHLHALGLSPRIMNRREHLWQRWLDPESASWLTQWFEGHGVPVIHETLNGFEGKTVLRNIQTKGGTRLPAGLVIMATGVEPNLGLVANTPLGTPNGMPVNELMETDEKGIYAVGDIALFPDPHFGSVRRSEHWESTLEQAAIAGGNITGKKRQKYKGFPRHSVTLFGTKMEFIGDFRQTPVRYEIEGDPAKGSFLARYSQGSRHVASFLCGQSPEQAAVEEALILKSRAK